MPSRSHSSKLLAEREALAQRPAHHARDSGCCRRRCGRCGRRRRGRRAAPRPPPAAALGGAQLPIARAAIAAAFQPATTVTAKISREGHRRLRAVARQSQRPPAAASAATISRRDPDRQVRVAPRSSRGMARVPRPPRRDSAARSLRHFAGGRPPRSSAALAWHRTTACFSRLSSIRGFVSIVACTVGGWPVARIAVVDDERDIREMLVDYLGLAGHEVVAAGGRGAGCEALLAAGPPPDLFVLDLGLPGRGRLRAGPDAAAAVRPGIVILTGAGDLVDRVVGLEIGADDYVRKPVELPELAARIAAVLRRRRPVSGAPAPAGPSFGPYSLDLRAFCVRDGDRGRGRSQPDGGGPRRGLRHQPRPGADPRRADAPRAAARRRQQRPLDRPPGDPPAPQARGRSRAPAADQDRARRGLRPRRLGAGSLKIQLTPERKIW